MYHYQRFLCNHHFHHISCPMNEWHVLLLATIVNMGRMIDTFTNRSSSEFCSNAGKFFISSTSGHDLTQDCPLGQDFSTDLVEREMWYFYPLSYLQISCACFTMTRNGLSAAEFPVILKQAQDILPDFEVSTKHKRTNIPLSNILAAQTLFSQVMGFTLYLWKGFDTACQL